MARIDEIHAMKASGKSNRQIAAELRLSHNTVRKYAGEFSRRQRANGDHIAAPVNMAGQVAWYERHIDTPELTDDSAAIDALLHTLATRNRALTVFIRSDHHFGDHDVRALALDIELIRALQPDLGIDNGDVYDFSTISRFAKSRNTPIADALKVVRTPYLQYVSERHDAARGCAWVHVTGNHDTRVNTWADEQWMLAETVVESYAALVRAEGRVLWGGWKQEIDVYGLNVRHGTRTNENAAKSTVDKDLAYGMSVSFGHTHRFGMYVRPQRMGKRRRYVTALNLGYGGNIPPAYASDQKSVDWVHGAALANVFTDGSVVNLQPLIYHETPDGGLTAFVGARSIAVDAQGRAVDSGRGDGLRLVKAA